ncbi:hypothetical protein ACHQM5_012086 [Ranunculus cassubicifolius]
MGNLRNALIALLVPLPSIAFYLYFLQHYHVGNKDLFGIWLWCYHHPLLLSSLLFFINISVLFWVISLIQTSHWMIDLYWTVLPVMLSIYYATHPLSQYNTMRSSVVIFLTLIWSLRLSHSYFRREKWQWGAREDWRFTSMRKDYGKNWWWASFFAVYFAQQVLMTGLCLPIFAIHTIDKPCNMWDSLAVIICISGIITAYFADTQLHEFTTKKPNGPVLDVGLWKYSRHPNYFGEQLWWWGLFVFGWNVGFGWSFIGSLMNSMCLAYVTALVEKRMVRHRDRADAYRKYRNETSVWIPWFKMDCKEQKEKNI